MKREQSNSANKEIFYNHHRFNSHYNCNKNQTSHNRLFNELQIKCAKNNTSVLQTLLDSSCNVKDYKANYLSKNILDSPILNKSKISIRPKDNKSAVQRLEFRDYNIESNIFDHSINYFNHTDTQSNNLLNYDPNKDSKVKFCVSDDVSMENSQLKSLKNNGINNYNFNIQKNNYAFYFNLKDKNENELNPLISEHVSPILNRGIFTDQIVISDLLSDKKNNKNDNNSNIRNTHNKVSIVNLNRCESANEKNKITSCEEKNKNNNNNNSRSFAYYFNNNDCNISSSKEETKQPQSLHQRYKKISLLMGNINNINKLDTKKNSKANNKKDSNSTGKNYFSESNPTESTKVFNKFVNYEEDNNSYAKKYLALKNAAQKLNKSDKTFHYMTEKSSKDKNASLEAPIREDKKKFAIFDIKNSANSNNNSSYGFTFNKYSNTNNNHKNKRTASFNKNFESYNQYSSIKKNNPKQEIKEHHLVNIDLFDVKLNQGNFVLPEEAKNNKLDDFINTPKHNKKWFSDCENKLDSILVQESVCSNNPEFQEPKISPINSPDNTQKNTIDKIFNIKEVQNRNIADEISSKEDPIQAMNIQTNKLNNHSDTNHNSIVGHDIEEDDVVLYDIDEVNHSK